MLKLPVDLIDGLHLKALLPSLLHPPGNGPGQEHGNPTHHQHESEPDADGAFDPSADSRT
jgi:hypothetical protein